jgi:hypothetical protein
MAIPDEAVSLSAERNSESGPFTLRLASGEHVGARSVVIATGARYRRLTLPDLVSPLHHFGSAGRYGRGGSGQAGPTEIPQRRSDRLRQADD